MRNKFDDLSLIFWVKKVETFFFLQRFCRATKWLQIYTRLCFNETLNDWSITFTWKIYRQSKRTNSSSSLLSLRFSKDFFSSCLYFSLLKMDDVSCGKNMKFFHYGHVKAQRTVLNAFTSLTQHFESFSRLYKPWHMNKSEYFRKTFEFFEQKGGSSYQSNLSRSSNQVFIKVMSASSRW